MQGTAGDHVLTRHVLPSTLKGEENKLLALVSFQLNFSIISKQTNKSVYAQVMSAMRHFEATADMTRLTLMTAASREMLGQSVDAMVERTQDFTDSAYTSHEHRSSTSFNH